MSTGMRDEMFGTATATVTDMTVISLIELTLRLRCDK